MEAVLTPGSALPRVAEVALRECFPGNLPGVIDGELISDDCHRTRDDEADFHHLPQHLPVQKGTDWYQLEWALGQATPDPIVVELPDGGIGFPSTLYRP